MSIEIVLYSQLPVRSSSPTLNSFVTKIEDGVETILGNYPGLGQSRKNLNSLLKSAGLKADQVTVREESNAGCAHWAELEGNKPVSNQPLFSVERRFELMGIAVNMVIKGALSSAIIVGQGGLGKTYTVEEAIENGGHEFTDAIVGEINGYESVSEENGEDEDKVVMVSGTVSKFGLYQVLHNHRNQTIVFDDTDSVLDDEDRINLLKAALDTKKTRRISWMSSNIDRLGYASSFEFTGKIIFISNRTMDRMPQALRSRSTMIDLTLSEKEIFDRIRNVGRVMAKDLSDDEVNMIVDFMYENRRTLKELSLRTFIKSAQFYKGDARQWQDMVLFLL